MKFYIFYSTGKYDPFILEKCDTEADVTAFLNKYVGNSSFEFTVVHGQEVSFKAVSVATKFERG